MVGGSGYGEQLRLEDDPVLAAWDTLVHLSERERALAGELEVVRGELYAHARAMRASRVATVAQIAVRLERNRQRVNAWMRTAPKLADDS